MSFRIVHLYPAEMNIYGDTGNVLALRRRLEWRGFEVDVDRVGVGEAYDLRRADVVVAGGGEDRAQLLVAEDLKRRAADIHEAVADDVAFLTVCGTYQLFGRRFITHTGDEIPGIGVFAAETVGGGERMIGNIVVEFEHGRLVGFENHSGRTFLDEGQSPVGRVIRGHGNNDTSAEEGAVSRNCFGTYLHGSVLPKNPALADDLLRRALVRRGESGELEPLDDMVEEQAARSAEARP